MGDPPPEVPRLPAPALLSTCSGWAPKRWGRRVRGSLHGPGLLLTRVLTPHGLPGCQAGNPWVTPMSPGVCTLTRSSLGDHLSSRAGRLREVKVQLHRGLPLEGYLHGKLLAVSELCVHLRLLCVRACHTNPSSTSRSSPHRCANFPVVAQGQPWYAVSFCRAFVAPV